MLEGGVPAWGRARPFVLLFLAMTLATLVTPYGPALHEQALAHVSQASTARFVEFRSPDFRNGGASVGCFEALTIATLLLGLIGRLRPTWGSVALLAATCTWRCKRPRHGLLFVLVAAAHRGRAHADARGSMAARRLSARWQAIGGAPGCIARPGEVHLTLVSVVPRAHGVERSPFPTALDGLAPEEVRSSWTLMRIASRVASTRTGWAACSLYRFWPASRVFVDDRTPVYGEAFMDDYFRVFAGRPGWQDVLARWGVTGAIVATGTPIAPVLRASPEWMVDYEDEQTLVCSRRGAP